MMSALKKIDSILKQDILEHEKLLRIQYYTSSAKISVFFKGETDHLIQLINNHNFLSVELHNKNVRAIERFTTCLKELSEIPNKKLRLKEESEEAKTSMQNRRMF